jgi:hypothetical protein
VGRARRIALVSVGAILLLLVLAQVLLPGIAADRISSRLTRYGHVSGVEVKAWPAIELLWGDADSVRVRASDLRVPLPATAKLLREASGAEKLDMSAVRVRVGPLMLSEASLHKRGSQLFAQALVSEAAVAEALPPGVQVRVLRSEGGTVEVSVGGSLFGVGGEIGALAQASGGKLVARPTSPLLDLFSLTLYEDRHVYVESVGATRTSAPDGYRLAMRARLQ